MDRNERTKQVYIFVPKQSEDHFFGASICPRMIKGFLAK